MFKRLPFAVAIACLTLHAPLHAESEAATGDEDNIGRFTFSGFGTLGAVHTRGNGAAFIRDITQPKGASNRGLSWETDSRFGIQATLKSTENLDVVAQVVSRYRPDNTFAPELTWGFIKYTPTDWLDIRAGRIGFDVYHASDSREVGYSYLWIRPPVEYYGTWTLLLPYEDGGDITFRMPVGEGISRFKLFTGIARQHVPYQLGQREWSGNMSTGPVGALADLSGSRVTGGFLDYQDDHWVLRVSHAQIRMQREMPAGLVDVLATMRLGANLAGAAGNAAGARALSDLAADTSLMHKKIAFSSIALTHDLGPWQTQLALSHMTSGSLVVADSNAGYASLAYRYGKLTPYLLLSAIRSRNGGRDDTLVGTVPPALVSLTKYAISTGLETQHTLSLGLRYDLLPNAALKLQFDRVRSNNCSPVSLAIVGPSDACAPPLLWPTVPVGWNGRANVISAALDFIY